MTNTPLSGARWIRAHATQTIMTALQGEAQHDQARFVGGCVRNALLGAAVDDVDIATVLTPQEVIARLDAAGLKAVPTGIDHGTVTGIANGKPFEITTLRKDVETDGRHAMVTFTTDWAEDAQRRDFTMNALYAGADGSLHDPLGGLADLEDGHVRFIGDPQERIREDYLRIMRFFRFTAWYGGGAFDEIGLEAVVEERDGLTGLSGERVQKELLKLLEAEDPGPALEAMAQTGVLEIVLKEAREGQTLAALVALEGEMMLPADGLRRLAALLIRYSRLPAGFAERLRLSNAQRKRLSGLLSGDWDAIAGADKQALRVLIYHHGVDAAVDLVLLAAAVTGGESDDVADALDVMRVWTPPDFPLSGADITALGVPKGPEVGKILRALETEWIDSGFTAEREALLARAKSLYP